MGLWISKQIMELHGGRLTAQSEGIGHGCTFTMEMPINDRGSTENLCHSPPTVLDISGLNKSASYSIDVHTPAPLLSQSLSKVGSFKALTNLPVFKKKVVPSSGESRLNPLNILVCDDSAPARKVLCKLLRSKGHTCLEAMDGAEAVEFLKGSFTDEDCAFNVILMDDQMPNLNGCNASRIIRQLGYIGIIIGITGNALPEEIENFVSFGADQVLPKPVSSELLFFTIHDIMTRKSASNDS